MAYRAVRPSPGMQTPQRQTTSSGNSQAAAAAADAPPGTPAGVSDSPGNWRHPRMDEITQRRAASVFTEANLKTAVYNGVALFLVFLAQRATGAPFRQLAQLLYFVVPPRHCGLLATLVYTVLALNIGRALLPLVRQPDTLADIPLTPSQRKLLGLPALHTPTGGTPPTGAAAAAAGYKTPPRYPRTPSVSGSAASLAAATRGSGSSIGSPGGGSGLDSTGLSRSFSGSPISNSPLFPKAAAARPLHGGSSGGDTSPFSPGSPFSTARRPSFGSPGSAPLLPGGGNGGASLFSDSTLSSMPGTPSPTSGKRLSMGLNNKWLYEKGRRSSGGARLY